MQIPELCQRQESVRYKVKLEIFEGPLDLLLYLIKKEEVDIHDIPIAKITDQYLEYLEVMKMLDLNIAGEFILMAATLMHIKSKMLLPPDDLEPLFDEDEKDPRAELIEKLLEYKKFKEAARRLEELELRQKNIFIRTSSLEKYKPQENEEMYFEASLFDLLTAFSKVLKEIPKEVFQEIIADEFTVEGKMDEVLQMLQQRESVGINKLFLNSKNKLEIAVVFLAVLELLRLREITVVQKMMFGEIEIRRNTARVISRLKPAEA